MRKTMDKKAFNSIEKHLDPLQTQPCSPVKSMSSEFSREKILNTHTEEVNFHSSTKKKQG